MLPVSPTPQRLVPLAQAMAWAQGLQAQADEWTYRAVAVNATHGTIAVYDEDNTLLGYL